MGPNESAFCSPAGLAVCLATAAVVLAAAAPCVAQRPILEVRLSGVGTVLVEGRLTAAGTLELPVAPIEELIGKSLGALPFLPLSALQGALGEQVRMEYDPRRALIVIDDPLRLLPAVRARDERSEAGARATPAIVYGRGPFSSITADEDGERLLEAGWNFGRLAVNVARSTVSGDQWGVAVQPVAGTWLTYQDGGRGRPTYAIRWARGRTFVHTSYASADESLRAQLGTSVGPLTMFVQREPRDWNAAVTLRGPMQVTIARVRERLAARISIGRNLSPFSLPRVR